MYVINIYIVIYLFIFIHKFAKTTISHLFCLYNNTTNKSQIYKHQNDDKHENQEKKIMEKTSKIFGSRIPKLYRFI